jgi:hypothetical protein
VGLLAVDLADIGLPPEGTDGYVGLVLFNTVMLLMLLVTALSLELRDLRRSTGRLLRALRLRGWALCGLATLIAATGASLILVWPLLGAALA